MKLDKEIVTEISETLKDASTEKLKRVEDVIENSDVSKEVKDAVKDAYSAINIDKDGKIENSEEPKQEEDENMKEKVVEDVAAALSIPGMQQYIDSLIKEALSKHEESVEEEPSKEASEEKIEDSEEKEKEEKTEEVDVSVDEEKQILIDSISSCALSLKTSEINMEDIEGSSAKYRDSLSEKTKDELKSLHSELITKVKEFFTNKPSESLEKETLSEDNPSGDSESEEKPASDTQRVLSNYFK